MKCCVLWDQEVKFCSRNAVLFLIGIEMKFNNQSYPILIAPTHIPELKGVEHTVEGMEIGASVTLNILEEVLKEAKYSLPGIK